MIPSNQPFKNSNSMEEKTHIYEIDINGSVQYWAFAKNQADAIAVMVESQGEWLDKIEDEVTITYLPKEKAGEILIRTDDPKYDGPQALYDMHLENPKRALVACSEW